MDMWIRKIIPSALQIVMMGKLGIPLTKGYKKSFDADYGVRKKDYAKYQAIPKKRLQIETDIERRDGLAVATIKREKELIENFKKEKYSFENAKIVKDPYGRTPLCAYVFFYTERESSVRFTVQGKTKEADICEWIRGLCKWHRVPLYGLYPGMENKVLLELLDSEGNVAAQRTILIKTEPLPDSMKDLVRVQEKKAPSAMKLIMVTGKSTPVPFAFDEQGDIRYIMAYRPRGYGFFELANGRFIIMERQTLIPTYLLPHSSQMYEIDYMGRVYKTYYVPNGVHHDVCEMTPGGNLLVASNSQCGHVEDCIVEINRYNGRIEKWLDTREILKTAYRDRTNWVHVNSLEYEEETGNVIVSARNIHAILSIHWKTNKLNWILADPQVWGWTPFGHKLLKAPKGMPFHYQQHSVKRIRENLDGREDTFHLIVFDNHWHKRRRVESFDHDDKSYVTIYTIHEKSGKVWLHKRFGDEKSKITSNGILKFEERRLFYMGGYLVAPELDENVDRGALICEYDYDSGESLNRYDLKYFFFRAFEMKPDIEDLSSAMDFFAEPVVGYLQPFEETQEEIGIPEKTIEEADYHSAEEKVQLCMEDENLWVRSKDHLIDQVFLVGEKKTYVRDFREPPSEQDLAADMKYYVSLPLYNLDTDIYRVVVEFRGRRYDAEKWIRITNV